MLLSAPERTCPLLNRRFMVHLPHLDSTLLLLLCVSGLFIGECIDSLCHRCGTQYQLLYLGAFQRSLAHLRVCLRTAPFLLHAKDGW